MAQISLGRSSGESNGEGWEVDVMNREFVPIGVKRGFVDGHFEA
jgi:hypothetical protein